MSQQQETVSEIVKQAETHEANNEHHKALTLYTRALSHDQLTKDVEYDLLVKRGYLFLKEDLISEASRDAQKALNLKPDSIDAYKLQIRVLKLQKNEEKLKSFISESIQYFTKLNKEQHVKQITDFSKVDEKHEKCKLVKLDDSESILECNLCLGIFYEPITLPCGHTFCRECISRVLDYTNKCPMCRTVCHINPQEHPCTLTIQNLCRKYFPEEMKKRKQELLESKKLNLNNVPLFVLDHIMFPGTVLGLHVFEPRYRLMMRRCMDGSRCFGIIGFDEEGDLNKCGCLVEIIDFRMLHDGRSLVRTKGKSRFKVIDSWDMDGYKCAKVELFEDKPVDKSKEEELKKVFEKVYETAKYIYSRYQETLDETVGELPKDTDPQLVSFWLSATLPFNHAEKYELLQSTDTLARLEKIESKANERSLCIIQ